MQLKFFLKLIYCLICKGIAKTYSLEIYSTNRVFDRWAVWASYFEIEENSNRGKIIFS